MKMITSTDKEAVMNRIGTKIKESKQWLFL